MSLIQLLLIIGMSASFFIYLAFFRSVLRDRLIAALLCSSSIFFILNPDATSLIAHYLGVGRGTDLLIYLFVSLSVFMFILAYSRISKLERSQTELARFIALESARKAANAN